jgi:hypothetical protein
MPAALEGAGGKLRGAGCRAGSARQIASHFQRFIVTGLAYQPGFAAYVALALQSENGYLLFTLHH